jgi:hypothetical protein
MPLHAEDTDVMKMMPAIQALLGQLGKPDANAQAAGANQGQQVQNPQATPQISPDAQAFLAQLMKAAGGGANANGAANADGGQADPSQIAKQLPQMLALLGQMLQSADGKSGTDGSKVDDAQAAKLLGQLQGLLGQLQQSAGGTLTADGAQAQNPQATKPATTPDLQALVGMLQKGLNSAPVQDAEAQAAAAAASATAAINQTIKDNTTQSPLKTNGLTTHGLQPAGSLGGAPRSDQDWRNLFPAK